MSKRRQRRLVDCGARLKVNMLGQQTEADAAGPYDVSPIRRLFGIDQAKDGRLARPIPANEPGMLARIYLQRYPAQDILSAVRFVYL